MRPSDLSNKRITVASPCTVGTVATRISISRPFVSVENWPSCGRRWSAIFMSESIFTRDVSGRWIFSGSDMTSCSVPSTRYRTRSRSSCGSRWMSEARAFAASSTMSRRALATGVSSAASMSACSSISAPRMGMRDRCS